MSDTLAKAHLTSLARQRDQDKINTALETIIEHWHGATHATAPEQVEGVKKQPPGSRLPMPLDPASAIDSAYRVLRSWGQLVMDERNLTTGPRISHRPECPMSCSEQHPSTGPQIARWLVGHSEWLAAHDTAREAARELGSHAWILKALALGHRTRKFQIGVCPEENYPEDGGVTTPCTGGLWSIIRDHETMLPDRVICDHNPEHVWAPYQWASLGRRMGNAGTDEMHREMTRMVGHTSQETA